MSVSSYSPQDIIDGQVEVVLDLLVDIRETIEAEDLDLAAYQLAQALTAISLALPFKDIVEGKLVIDLDEDPGA